MKLVRENIAKKIISENSAGIFQATSKEEFITFLKLKLMEELSELKESEYKDVSEYADVIEVLETLAEQSGLSFQKILEEKNNKLKTNGDFRSALIVHKKLT